MSNFPEPPIASPEDVQANKALAAVTYILFFIPLLAAPNSRFAMYHANQSLLLLITSIACNILLGLIPLVGWILLPFANIAVLVLFIIGILNAVNGKMKPLPLIGSIQLIKHP